MNSNRAFQTSIHGADHCFFFDLTQNQHAARAVKNDVLIIVLVFKLPQTVPHIRVNSKMIGCMEKALIRAQMAPEQ